MIPKYNIGSKRIYSFQDNIRRSRFSKILPAPGFTYHRDVMPKKTVTFHLDFGSEILEQARYERLTLYSIEHRRLTDEALGRKKGE